MKSESQPSRFFRRSFPGRVRKISSSRLKDESTCVDSFFFPTQVHSRSYKLTKKKKRKKRDDRRVFLEGFPRSLGRIAAFHRSADAVKRAGPENKLGQGREGKGRGAPALSGVCIDTPKRREGSLPPFLSLCSQLFYSAASSALFPAFESAGLRKKGGIK